MQSKESMPITIGDQTFRIRVSPEERDRFARIARSTNELLIEITRSGAMPATRALAMTSFQLAVELDELRSSHSKSSQGLKRIDSLIQRIDQVTENTSE